MPDGMYLNEKNPPALRASSFWFMRIYPTPPTTVRPAWLWMRPMAVLRTASSTGLRHLQAHYLEGSDPGICMACEGDPGLSELMNFGISCIRPVVSQKDALGKSSAADRTKGNRRNEKIKFYRFAAFRRTGGEPLLVLPCCYVCRDMAICMPVAGKWQRQLIIRALLY